MKKDAVNTELLAILTKLDKLTYTSEDNKTLQTQEGFTVQLYTKMHSSKSSFKIPSIQVIMRVAYKGQLVTQWGCSDELDTRAVVDFFLDKQVIAQREEDKQESSERKSGINIFNNL